MYSSGSKLHGVSFQKIVILIFDAVKTHCLNKVYFYLQESKLSYCLVPNVSNFSKIAVTLGWDMPLW